MAENKTKPTDASVEDDILSRASEQQRTDCHENRGPNSANHALEFRE
jgi:hypothetical protein